MDTITIKKIVNGGSCLAKLDNGMTLFVKHVLPGEVITYKLGQKKKNYSFAKSTAIIEKHPGRTSPECSYYTKCGGCDLMHCSYSTQLELKKEIVTDLFKRHSGGVLASCIDKIYPVMPSAKELFYRQRIRLQIDEDGTLGFRKHQSHEIIPIELCKIAYPEINLGIKHLLYSDTATELFNLSSELEIHVNPATLKLTLILHFTRKPRPADNKKVKRLLSENNLFETIVFSGKDFAPIKINSPDFEKQPDFQLHLPKNSHQTTELTLQWESGGFCQVNLEQNLAMVDHVLQMADIAESETVLDLFCGMGNFSLPIALKAKSVHGIEGQRSSIRSAKKNAERNNLTNTTFQKSDIEEACDTLIADGKLFDCVIIDPPRIGIPGLTQKISKLASKKIIYVSCDPATLCRDLADLLTLGFQIITVQPVDMFPQTHHIENIILLEKN